MTALAMPLPVAVIAELFGVRGSEVDGLRAVADALLGYTDRGRADAPTNWLNPTGGLLTVTPA